MTDILKMYFFAFYAFQTLTSICWQLVGFCWFVIVQSKKCLLPTNPPTISLVVFGWFLLVSVGLVLFEAKKSITNQLTISSDKFADNWLVLLIFVGLVLFEAKMSITNPPPNPICRFCWFGMVLVLFEDELLPTHWQFLQINLLTIGFFCWFLLFFVGLVLFEDELADNFFRSICWRPWWTMLQCFQTRTMRWKQRYLCQIKIRIRFGRKYVHNNK